MPVSYLYVFIGKLNSSAHCFDWGTFFLILNCMNNLNILDTKLLLVISFENIFFPFYKLSFHLVDFCSAMENLLNIVRSYLLFFC